MKQYRILKRGIERNMGHCHPSSLEGYVVTGFYGNYYILKCTLKEKMSDNKYLLECSYLFRGTINNLVLCNGYLYFDGKATVGKIVEEDGSEIFCGVYPFVSVNNLTDRQ